MDQHAGYYRQAGVMLSAFTCALTLGGSEPIHRHGLTRVRR